MKIMTYNVQHCTNYLEKKIDYEIIANTINSLAPDFVILNEMRDRGDVEGFVAQTEILAKMCNMEYSYFAKAIDVRKESSPYGNAIISKHRILSAKTVMIPDPTERNGTRWYESRCILKAELECGLTVLGVHVGLNPEEQELAVKTLLDNLEDERCVLLGDFNMRPENPRIQPIMLAMKDTAEKFTEPKLSCPSDVPRSKIDYIFVSKDIEVLSADIPEIVSSDHRPHVAEIIF